MTKLAEEAYVIIDIGTGNVRVAMVSQAGLLMGVERDNVRYEQDDRYPDALYFDPVILWEQILSLTDKVIRQSPGVVIKAFTAGSQREGIVLLDRQGRSLIGFPNHDHRGREWESMITDSHFVYTLTGRYPSSLFSALKLVGWRERDPEQWAQVACFMSISDWAQYQLSGVRGYEHSQASETLLYDVEQACWSTPLCDLFGIEAGILPPLVASGTVLGQVLPGYAGRWQLSPETPVIVGGADTQLAIKSTHPASEDIVIVSGTTTPVIKITDQYLLDDEKRTWTNRHIEKDQFIVETNCGVTGLNYQRLKALLYPDDGYDLMETELDQLTRPACMASLGSLVASEKSPLSVGGFVFNVPVSHQLTRADWMWATLWDIACSVKENFDALCDRRPYLPDYVWACGGGFQSRHLRQFVAGLIQKKLRIRQGFQQASVMGGLSICVETLQGPQPPDTAFETIDPEDQPLYREWYEEWKKLRSGFKQYFLNQ